YFQVQKERWNRVSCNVLSEWPTMLPRASNSSIFLVLFLTASLWFYLFYNYVHAPSIDPVSSISESEIAELNKRILKLDVLVAEERSALRAMRTELEAAERENQIVRKESGSSFSGAWPDPIPILVFVCNRAEAIKNHLEHLIRTRPSASRFPIVVSQDCDSEDVRKTVESFGDKVLYVKHLSGAKANIQIPLNHVRYTTYYRIARHYKLGLDHVFNKLGFTSVVITEDDLDVAADFFEYFSATRKLLAEDDTLFCVSAWNDNGKENLIDSNDPSRLYRTDFFSGLGWMMSSDLWKEFAPIWPSGFWDDWMRDPLRRKDRKCIRPEMSRTAMTIQGKTGASRGLFFDKHLIKVKLNQIPVNFTTLDLGYLRREKYDADFHRIVYEESILMNSDDAQKELINKARANKHPIRIEYTGNMDYIKKADKLHIMHDFKAGVPRTAYQGVVSCFINGRRVFLAPDRNQITKYDPSWHVPDNMEDV
ncbi:gly-13, partial [Pristionchus pacificus]